MNIRKAPSSWIVTHLRCGTLSALRLSIILVLPLLASSLLAQSTASFSPDAEQEIVRLVNRERQSRGVATLVVDERLQQAARKHSERMAESNMVEHQLAGEQKPVLRLGAGGLRFDASGENVARADDAPRAHTALMNSPGHRHNILNPAFTAIGVGVVSTPQGIYVTQDFARRLPEATVDEAEEQVSSSLNRIRRAAGMPIMSQVPAPDLRQRACEMAEKNKLDPHVALTPKTSNSVVFTAIDLTQVSKSLDRLKTSPARTFSVGACYRSSANYENPVFWIIVVTYF